MHARVRSWREIFSKNECHHLLRAETLENVSLNTADELIAAYLDRNEFDAINKILYLDVKDSLPDDMLNKVDRMSMLNALEVRVPFLDHEVAEFVFRLAGERKLHRGYIERYEPSDRA